MTMKKGKSKKVKSNEPTPTALDLDEIDQACKEIEEEVKKSGKKTKAKKVESTGDEMKTDTKNMTFQKESAQYVKNDSEIGTIERSQSWISQTVRFVVEHLNKFGACVIDDFLGENKGIKILNEVLNLRSHQTFQEGQLATVKTEKSVRSDKITWTDGSSPATPNIKYLMNTIDSIVMTANKAPNNGVLSNYNISSRTKAMVACYPGEGTHYVKHIDNPSRDGRCITAIYYLNRNWDAEKDGGSLKIYSACVEGVIAQVEPIFDRVIFFWSDRRNPHEVRPAFRERYAITVWYMDEKEKREFEERKRLKLSEGGHTSVIQRNPT